MRRHVRLVAAASACLFWLGCEGQSATALTSGSGGSSPAGGSPSSGGSAGGGGSGDIVGSGGTTTPVTSSGGGAGASGGTGTGGTTGSGGSAGSGGTTNARSGGSVGSGGTTNARSGGAAGGAATRGTGGGTTSPSGTGGRTPSGGAAGGATTRGTGGTAGPGAGGTQGAGGTPGTGGTSATGTSTWPQCFGTDTVPTTELKLRAPTGDYATQVAVGGVAMIIGANRQSCLTDSVVNFDVKDLNQEIIDVVETVKFYGFLDWKRGYYMNWVILNSGIPGATISGQGGHQGDRYGHMNFESSEECPCNWGTGDSSNRGNALHESIHAIQAELWAFNNQGSGWIHEAHNCYTGTMRAHLVENLYTMGYGAAYALMMPHGPIESMGMNTDDSWAGPSDQNAKTYVNSIVRYGLEIFWLNLNLEMGQGFINCIWDSASKSGKPDSRQSGPLSGFQALQKAAGNEAAAHVIQSFGARSAILDYAGWTSVVRSTLKGNWNSNYWFYTFPSGDGTSTFSPPAKNLPHHQGRNIIPIKVAAGATSVTVEFTPDATGSKGTAASMQAQLVYRDAADTPVYGTVFGSGQNTIQLPNGVRNGIVNLVVAVTNPNGTGAGDDNSGKGFDAQEHFNYQARLVSGGTIAPTSTTPW